MVGASFLSPIAFDVESGEPLYRQLYHWFQAAIRDGRLRPGQRVPSTRSLAAELRISRIPVLTAYEQLTAEGYLESLAGSGTFVAGSIPDCIIKADQAVPVTLPIRRLRKPSRRVETLMIKTGNLAPRVAGAFRTCDPAVDQFPAKLWSALVSRHARSASFALNGYGDPMGRFPLIRKGWMSRPVCGSIQMRGQPMSRHRTRILPA